MEYIVEFRVFRGDEGWHYTVEFVTRVKNADYTRAGGPYRTETVATNAGLRALAAAINKRRKEKLRYRPTKTGRTRTS